MFPPMWIKLGSVTHYLREPQLLVNFFDLTHWRLIEAKADIPRERIRKAIGQLRDYRRFYRGRRPSLAVLLPARPTGSYMKLLTENSTAVIWKTGRRGFRMLPWQSR